MAERPVFAIAVSADRVHLDIRAPDGEWASVSLDEIAHGQPPAAAVIIRKAIRAAVDEYLLNGRPLDAAPVPPDWICELHPWMEWPHHDCPGPGLHVTERDTLHETASVLSDRDQRAFRRLLFAVRAGDALAVQAALRDLEHRVPDPVFDEPRE